MSGSVDERLGTLQASNHIQKLAGEWTSNWVILASGLFLFEALSGIWIYFLGFSLPAQFIVLFHTLIGLAWVAPYAIYQLKHYLDKRGQVLNHIKFLGYATCAALVGCAISGLVLTAEAAFGARINYTWDLIHIISGLASLALLLLHVGLIILRYVRQRDVEHIGLITRAQNRFGARALAICAGVFVVFAAAVISFRPVQLSNTFPQDYSFKYGSNPFAPSLARTSTGGAIDPRVLANSTSCGTAGCHEQIVHEWQPSAHRYASKDTFFQAVQTLMARQNGPEATRYCAGCHDPIALFSGSKNISNESLSSYGADEGISCVVCHSITQTDVKGNANYTLTAPLRYAFELRQGRTSKFLSDFLIRAYPQQHKQSYSRPLYKTAEYCGACHKQFIDKEVNNVGWVQLQNQYDNWRKSHWNAAGDPRHSLTCRECHMRLTASRDPAAGDASDFNRRPDDGKHRSHRFIAANQYIPTLLRLPGADEQVRLTEEWLKGETVIPEIRDRWATGPVIPLDIIAPKQATAGEEIKLRVVSTSNKVGHDFPTGPLDIIQCWIELSVQDDQGQVIFHSGDLDQGNRIEPGSFVFKAEGIDQYGRVIDRHNLWQMIGVRFRRSLFPGYADTAEFQFRCPGFASSQPPKLPRQEVRFKVPGETVGQLHVRARLRYRKVNQAFIQALFKNSDMRAPITDMSSASTTIDVVRE